jgi:hypothetical protein
MVYALGIELVLWAKNFCVVSLVYAKNYRLLFSADLTAGHQQSSRLGLCAVSSALCRESLLQALGKGDLCRVSDLRRGSRHRGLVPLA